MIYFTDDNVISAFVCAQVAADNRSAERFVDLGIERLTILPIVANQRTETPSRLSHDSRIVAIEVITQVVIVPDHFMRQINTND